MSMWDGHSCAMLRGCSILVLQPPDEAVPAARELRDRVAASGAASSSVNGEPPLEANKLTHIVAEGWATVAGDEGAFAGGATLRRL
jgi:hypothetical protein